MYHLILIFFNGGTYTALNLQHTYGMRFLISTSTQSQLLMTMDTASGIAMNTSLYIDNNLSNVSIIDSGSGILDDYATNYFNEIYAGTTVITF